MGRVKPWLGSALDSVLDHSWILAGLWRGFGWVLGMAMQQLDSCHDNQTGTIYATHNF